MCICRKSQQKISIVNLGVIYIAMAYFSRLLCISLGYHICFFYVCLAQSDQCISSRADVSFCLILPAPCSRFCQFDVLSTCHWSVTQPSLLFKSQYKNCRTIIQLTCTFLLTNKIYCEYSEGLEKLLFLATILYVVKTKITFKKHNITYVIFFTLQRHERCFICN